MSISLNSPKYAETKSLAYQMHKKQQDRKLRKNPFTPQLFERFFRRNEGTTDHATIPSVTLSGYFVIEFEFLTSSTLSNQTIFSSANQAGEVGVDITSSGVLRVFNFNDQGTFQGTAQTTIGGFNNGLLHKCTISFNGLTASISVDGGSQGSINWSTFNGASFDNLYRRVSTSGRVFSGILANLRIYDNGTLIRDYPLDDNTDILRNRVATVGAELWKDDSVSSFGESSYLGGVAHIISTGADSGVRVSGALVVGVQYIVGVEVFDYVSGAVRVGDGGTVDNVYSANGFYSAVITADQVTSLINRNVSGTNLKVRGITYRQADGYGTVINGTPDQWALYQQQVTGEWLGQELVPQPIEFSANWRERGDQAGQGISGDSYITVSTAGQGVSIPNRGIGDVLRVNYDVSCDDVFWNFNDWTGTDFGELVTVVSSNQSGVFDYTPQQSEIYLRHDTSAATMVTLNSFSIKEVLNVA